MYPVATQYAISVALSRTPDERTWCDKIMLNFYYNNGELTTSQLARYYYHFNARLSDLKERGVEFEETKRIDGKGIWRYRLKGASDV